MAERGPGQRPEGAPCQVSGSTLHPSGTCGDPGRIRRLQGEGGHSQRIAVGLPRRNRRGPPRWPVHLLRPQWQQGPWSRPAGGRRPPCSERSRPPSPAPSGPAASQRRRPTLPGAAQCAPPPGRARRPGLRGQGGATREGGVAGVLRPGEAAVLCQRLTGSRPVCRVCPPVVAPWPSFQSSVPGPEHRRET